MEHDIRIRWAVYGADAPVLEVLVGDNNSGQWEEEWVPIPTVTLPEKDE